MAPALQNRDAEAIMIGLITAVAGALLLLNASRGKKLAPQPVRARKPQR